MRFPRFIRIRDDKKPEQATTSEQVADFYNKQQIVVNQEKAKQNKKEIDFYWFFIFQIINYVKVVFGWKKWIVLFLKFNKYLVWNYELFIEIS